MRKIFIVGLIMSVITAGVYGNENGIFSFKVGQLEVFMLVESERDGNTAILPGVDEAVLNQYIPAQGFKHSANAFLIKAPRQQYILIDSGTGAGGIIVEKIKSLGVDPEKINTVLITHLHGDHFGGLVKDGRAVYPNAKIYLSAKELEYFTVTNVNQGAVNALAPYKSKIVTFNPGALSNRSRRALLPGIFPIEAYGHTPGHTIFLIENGRDKLLIVGDLLHVALVQFPVPSVSASYDMDGQAAARIRAQVFAYAAANKIPVGGMHMVYPGVGTLEAYNQGSSFNFLPME
jgi:glyoxylase-like metal-dependent hydrolase (beta-lactamase superfamily II)